MSLTPEQETKLNERCVLHGECREALREAYALGAQRVEELEGKLREAEFWKKANDNTFQHCANRVTKLQSRLASLEAKAGALLGELDDFPYSIQDYHQ